MGEEVTQLVIADAGRKEEEPHSSADETDKASVPALNGEELIEKCEDIKTNCDGKPLAAEELIVEKSAKRIIAINNIVVANKPRDISIEKTRKWYSFIHRGSRSSNSCESKNSTTDKMDKRHSWHLNDLAVVEM